MYYPNIFIINKHTGNKIQLPKSYTKEMAKLDLENLKKVKNQKPTKIKNENNVVLFLIKFINKD